MSITMTKMESAVAAGAQRDAASLAALLEMLRDPDWRVRYAAAVGLQDRGDPAAIPGLLAALAEEETAPLFSSPELPGADFNAAGAQATEVVFPPGTSEETKEAWRRRGRVKQAVVLALGAIASDAPEVLAVLHRYARDAEQDYAVRASACHALGEIASPASLTCLEAACSDEEGCTRMEAVKGRGIVGSRQSTVDSGDSDI